jgi:GPH family glycoside/pentoside/hexuronide:cation symporter
MLDRLGGFGSQHIVRPGSSIGGIGEAGAERLSLPVIWAYAMPRIAFAVMGTVMGVYFMKYSTDVLLIAPAAIGVIVAGARIWDAVSDPMAGYLSDRTRSRFGRRRVWMFAAAVPLGLSIVMLWSPPAAMQGVVLIGWMSLAILLYETATTAYYIPHGAIGVELTPNYHERTRLFGYAHLIGAFGSVLGLVALHFFDVAEDKRTYAGNLSIFAGVFVAIIIVWSTRLLPERADFQGRGGDKIFRSFWDVARNPHARLLLIVYAIESFGSASVLLLAPYVLDYVWAGMAGKLVLVMVAFIVPLYGFTPVWMWLARRFEKKHLWLTSLWMSAASFFAFWFVTENEPLVWISLVLIGISGSCGAVVEPSIKADVIDYDEYMTRQRKEGTYYAVWNLVRKGAGSVTALATGLVLQLSGFEPNVEQTESAQLGLRTLVSLLPGGCYVIGALLFTRFKLNEAEHTEIRRVLEERQAAAAAS